MGECKQINFIETLKELRLFIAFIASIVGTSALSWETVMNYVYTYHIHLAVITLVGIYINHFLSNKRHKSHEYTIKSLQEQLTHLLNENAKTQIRAEIRQAYKDFKDVDVIDFESSVKYLQDLEKRRLELGINSYTDGLMEILLKKIEIK